MAQGREKRKALEYITFPTVGVGGEWGWAEGVVPISCRTFKAVMMSVPSLPSHSVAQVICLPSPASEPSPMPRVRAGFQAPPVSV